MKMDDRVRPLVSPSDSPSRDSSTPAFRDPTSRSEAFEPRVASARPPHRAVATTASRASASPIVVLLIAAALIWVVAIAGLVVRAHGAGGWRGPELALALALALIPAGFIGLFAFALEHLLRLADDVRTARALSDDLVGPAALAASHVGGVVEAVRTEIDRAAGTASDALSRLNGLRSALAEEGTRIAEVAGEAERQSHGVADRLRAERVDLERLSSDLGSQARELDDALAERSRLFLLAAEAASVQMRAASDNLEGGVERLTIAAEAADRAAEGAAGKLTTHADRLSEVGTAIGGALAQFSGGLAEERESLAGMVETLRLEHEDAAALSETRTARLRAEVVDARTAADVVAESASHAVEALRVSMAEAVERLRAVADLGRGERQRLAEEIDAELDRLSVAADERRDALLQASRNTLDALNGVAVAAAVAAEGRLVAVREGADRVAEATRARVDELGEAAFEIGRRADQAFEARVVAAHRAIEAVSAALEEASRRAAARVEAELAGPREALHELESLLHDFDARLPQEARSLADEVQRSIDDGVEALAAAARRTTQETLAVDAAFQDRVRTNYASLSEAVRLMSAAVESSDSVERVKARPIPAVIERTAPPGDAKPILVERADDARAKPEAGVELDLQRAGASRRAAGGGSGLAGAPAPSPPPTLRPRLRLTPTREDEAAHALFDTPAENDPSASASEAGASASREAGWSWKDLLSSVDETAAGDEDETAGRMASEIAALGLDADALLPNSRTLEASHALATGGLNGVRDTVRRIAPAAVRRLSRRVLTDRLLRTDAARFLREQQSAIVAADRAGGGALPALFASDVGRTYLLLDAAVGDVD